MRKVILSVSLLAASALIGAEAATLDFSYGTPDEEFKVYGYQKKETYDVAIYLGKEMAGSKVTKFTVPLPTDKSQVANVKGWLSSELKLENKKNVADLATVDAQFDDWTLTATFAQPVVVPEGGIYVGYSFDVVSLDEIEGEYSYPGYPIACVIGDNPAGMYIHTSRSVLKWKSFVSQLNAVSPMVVSLEGDFFTDAAAPAIPAKPYVEIGKPGTVNFTVSNHGVQPISNISYSIKADGVSASGTYTFETPIEASFGATAAAVANVPAFENYGTYQLTLTIDKVNGKENLGKDKSVTTDFVVAPFVPKNRPLVEEYTGLWCGYCPAGYVALEELSEELGSDFIALSYHNGDRMEIMEATSFPIAQFQSSIGYPASQVNRDVSEYPETETLRLLWNKYAAVFTPSNIEVEMKWADDEHSAIDATASVRFVEDLNSHNYKVAFALVADNLSNPLFIQNNNYVGEDYTGKWWDLFTQGESKVKGLVFNSIVSATSDINGIAGSIPETIKMGETYESTYRFDMKNVRNTSRAEFLNPDCKLRVVAYIVDGATRRVVNSNTSAAQSGYVSGVEAVEMETSAVVRSEYFDLQGRRLATAADKGISIRVDYYENGSRKSVKVRK